VQAFGTPENAWFRQVLGYWNMVASLVLRGTLHEGLVFDNSAESKRQPSKPPRAVSWGEGTTDEMALVFVSITVDGERIGWRPR